MRHPSDPTTGSPTGAAVRPGEDPDEVYVLRLCLDLTLDAMLLALGAAAADPVRQPARAPGTRTGAVRVGGPGGVRWGGPPGAFPPVPSPGSSPLSGPIPTRSVRVGPGSAPSVPAEPAPAEPAPASAGSVAAEPASAECAPVRSVAPEPEPDGVRWQRWLREDVEQARSLAVELLDRGGGLPSWLAAARASGSSAAVVARLESFHAQTQALLTELELTLDADPGAADRIGAPHVHAAVRHVQRRLGELELLRRELQATQPPAVTVPNGLPGEFLG